MNLFENVKAVVTVRQAAEHYGLKVGRGDMACCPFHNDRTPSMKLNEDYFYCFGCGASGDVIDLAARLFGLSGYDAAKKLAELLDIDLKNAGKPEMANLPDKLRAYGAEKAAAECGVGVPTLQDIVKELVKPGRDPRDELPAPILRTDVLELKDLKPGMVLSGTVRNVIDFGVFVDIGVHQDGLVHISQVSNKFIKHPSEVVSVGDVVKVAVLDVDQKRGRISLTMKGAK